MKSTGPKTKSGKAASARNATRHGLSSTVIAVLPAETQSSLDALTETLTAEHKPQGDAETFLVDQMIQARWKLARIQRLEAEAFDEILEEKGGASADRRLLHTLAAGGNILDKLERYRVTAERSYYKAVRELQALRFRVAQNEAKNAEARLKELEANPVRYEACWVDPPKPEPDSALEPGYPDGLRDPQPLQSPDLNP